MNADEADGKLFFVVDRSNSPTGPFSLRELAEKQEAGVLKPGTMVIRQGEKTYSKWKDVLQHVTLPPTRAELKNRDEAKRKQEAAIPQMESEQTSGGSTSGPPSARQRSLHKVDFDRLKIRYKNGYSLAKACTGFSQILRALGMISLVGCGFSILMMIVGSTSDAGAIASALSLPFVIASIPVAIMFFAASYVLGVQASLLRAQLDTAINTSTLLSDDQKLGMMD